MQSVGTKLQVFRGNAAHTSGGLKKDDLMKNKRGKIVSKKRHELGKIAFAKNGLKPKTAEELSTLRNR